MGPFLAICRLLRRTCMGRNTSYYSQLPCVVLMLLCTTAWTSHQGNRNLNFWSFEWILGKVLKRESFGPFLILKQHFEWDQDDSPQSIDSESEILKYPLYLHLHLSNPHSWSHCIMCRLFNYLLKFATTFIFIVQEMNAEVLQSTLKYYILNGNFHRC